MIRIIVVRDGYNSQSDLFCYRKFLAILANYSDKFVEFKFLSFKTVWLVTWFSKKFIFPHRKYEKNEQSNLDIKPFHNFASTMHVGFYFSIKHHHSDHTCISWSTWLCQNFTCAYYIA